MKTEKTLLFLFCFYVLQSSVFAFASLAQIEHQFWVRVWREYPHLHPNYHGTIPCKNVKTQKWRLFEKKILVTKSLDTKTLYIFFFHKTGCLSFAEAQRCAIKIQSTKAPEKDCVNTYLYILNDPSLTIYLVLTAGHILAVSWRVFIWHCLLILFPSR